jgi:hypothetical protein
MRWSGLAIKDAVGLKRDRLDERGVLFLRRAKTGVPVFVPLPPAVESLAIKRLRVAYLMQQWPDLVTIPKPHRLIHVRQV